MIDWARVAQLRDEIGEEDFEEVVALFLEEVECEIATLGSDSRCAQVEAQMHLLKGAALNLGFHSLAENCQRAETAAASGQAEGIVLAETVSCYERSKADFLAKLGPR